MLTKNPDILHKSCHYNCISSMTQASLYGIIALLNAEKLSNIGKEC